MGKEKEKTGSDWTGNTKAVFSIIGASDPTTLDWINHSTYKPKKHNSA